MLKKQLSYICVFFTLCMALPISATDKISIVIPDNFGYQIDQALLNKVFGTKINYDIQPLKRASFEFQRGEFHCFMGGSIKTMKNYYNIEVIESIHYLNWGVGVFTLRSKKTINNIAELENKSAVMVRGDIFLKNIKDKYKLSGLAIVTNEEQAVAMLKANRVDVAFNWFPVPKEINDIHRNKKLSLYRDQARLVCLPSVANEILIQKFNEHLQKLKDTDWLKKMQDSYFQ